MIVCVSVFLNKLLDVEDFINGNDIGVVVFEDNDEFGENVGEGNSYEMLILNFNNEILKVNNSVCEGDIMRKKFRGDVKEKDLLRFMKFFQVALMKFVKDFLKFLWR